MHPLFAYTSGWHYVKSPRKFRFLLVILYTSRTTPFKGLRAWKMWIVCLSYSRESLSQFEAVPESLKNMLLVMSTAGIFDEEECTLTAHSQSTNDRKTHKRSDSEIHKYSALWQVTWERIDCFLPNLRQELFTPRTQSSSANEAQEKTEQEKTTNEETEAVASPQDPGLPVEGRCYMTCVVHQCPLFLNLLCFQATL